MIFSTAAESIRGSDTKDIEFTRDKMILEILEMLNFEIWVLPVTVRD